MPNDMCGLLMRFRLHKIGIVSDIEKAFLQVGLQPNERDVTISSGSRTFQTQK